MALDKHPDVIAKVVFVLEGDDPTEQQQAMVIQHDEALWLVATWLENAEGKRVPEWLVPLANLGPTWEPIALFRLAQQLPKELFSSPPSKEVLRRFGAVMHPGIFRIQGPTSSH